MLISIVVPVYNVEKYLDDCVMSIYPQISKRNDVELILVDDGSKDKSGEICDKYAALDPEKIRVFHKENEGLMLTRRYGLERAAGEYIINCDSDDMLEPQTISSLAEEIEKSSPDVIFYNASLLEGEEKKPFFSDIFGTEKVKRLSKKEVTEEFFRSTAIVSLCMKAYKKSLVNPQKNDSDIAYIKNGEDSLQSIGILTAAESFVYYNQPFYVYRMGSGMTSSFDNRYYESFKTVIERSEKSELYREFGDANHHLDAKFFSCVARAVTQMQFDTKMSWGERKQYLKQIREDELFIKKLGVYALVKGRLSLTHKVFCRLLICKMYLVICAVLKLKALI